MNDRTSAREITAYRVLARKYRPTRFADLIGQEGLVRTLTNAIGSGRLAHAFVLTGVRGVGKTTTARIIARALNCIGEDGKGGPTAEPCGLCANCTAISEDRHVDVIEMDAASRTGVGDIRELIEGVRYRPVQARYKIYIIDEVHMLSTSAFNALLKTLEEPPEHVVFVFATTEIRKVPVTVLSRCQRFDLRRVPQERLAEHFASIAAKEEIEFEAAALAMIARAADGSVRDGLSLLDQAIALGDGKVSGEQVKSMLGLADRVRLVDLCEEVLRGRIADALETLGDLYAAGADPLTVLQDLLEFVHFLTRAKLTPTLLEDPAVPEAERTRGGALAGALDLAELARAWQILLKGLGEVQSAPVPLQAAEMVLIRLAHASSLPTPGELVKRLREGEEAQGEAPARPGRPSGSAGAGGSLRLAGGTAGARAPEREARPEEETRAEAAVAPPSTETESLPRSFAELVQLVEDKREPMLAVHLRNDVHLVRFEVGILEFRTRPEAPRDMAGRLGRLLQDWTGRRWIVGLSKEEGQPTLRAQEEVEEARRRSEVMRHPLVQAALEVFPGAKLVARREAEVAEGNEVGGGQAGADEGDEPR